MGPLVRAPKLEKVGDKMHHSEVSVVSLGSNPSAAPP